MRLGKVVTNKRYSKIDASVRGTDVYVVQSTSPPVSDNLMELLLMISALRNASCRHVTAIVPYFGYMRSDGSELPARKAVRKSQETVNDDDVSIEMDQTHQRTSYLAMADVARMFEVVGCSRVVTFDLHSSGQSAAEGFFAETRVENIRSGPIVAREIAKQLGLERDRELVVVASHSSCFSKAKKFQYHLKSALATSQNVGLALVVRRPPFEGSSDSVTDLVGDVSGKDVLIVEDVVDTGRSLARAARAAKEAGANRVFGFASHAVLSGNASQRIQNCEPLEKLAVLNTVPISRECQAICQKFAVIDISAMVANTVMDLHMKEDVRASS